MIDQNNWNQAWTRYREFNFKKLNKIYDEIGIDALPRNSKVLDLGCGTGEFLKILIGKGFQDVLGLEPEAELVKEASAPYIQQGNCLAPPSHEGKFDAIVMLGVLHHLKSLDEVTVTLKNIKTMLKPGGEFYSLEPRNSVARTIATRMMFALPMALLPERVKIDRILVDEERTELDRWLGYEHLVSAKAIELGLHLKTVKSDWKSAYQIFSKELPN